MRNGIPNFQSYRLKSMAKIKKTYIHKCITNTPANIGQFNIIVIVFGVKEKYNNSSNLFLKSMVKCSNLTTIQNLVQNKP